MGVDGASQGKTLRDYLKFLWRRKFILGGTALLVYAAAVFYALTAPAVYQAEATILVEDQSVSPNYVRSAITGFASQQVQVISQRVITVETAAAIANKYKLYLGDSGRPRTPSAALERTFRRDMSLELVSAETIDPRNYRKTEVTIAFTLGFKAGDAVTAKQVTDELVTLFLNENQRDRSSVAASTSQFLAGEAERLNAELLELERELAEFKLANDGSLPEQYEFNLDTLERTQRKLSDATLRRQELQTQQIELRARLAGLPPTVAPSTRDNEQLTDLDRLRALQAERRRKSAVYKDTHPDLVRLTREINELQKLLGVASVDTEMLQEQLTLQRNELTRLRERFNEEYFEVVNARRMVENLEQKLVNAQRESDSKLEQQAAPNNPAYLLVSSQLDAVNSELASLAEEQTSLERRSSSIEERLRQSPNVEREYNALLRNYEIANEKFQDFQAKAREAAVASNLEVEQKGERFIVIEPAVTPTDPISPNRTAIVMIGFVLALGLGLAVALIKDLLQGAVHGAADVARLVGAPPLAVVPYIDNHHDEERQRWAIYGAGALTLSLALAFAVYFVGFEGGV